MTKFAYRGHNKYWSVHFDNLQLVKPQSFTHPPLFFKCACQKWCSVENILQISSLKSLFTRYQRKKIRGETQNNSVGSTRLWRHSQHSIPATRLKRRHHLYQVPVALTFDLWAPKWMETFGTPLQVQDFFSPQNPKDIEEFRKLGRQKESWWDTLVQKRSGGMVKEDTSEGKTREPKKWERRLQVGPAEKKEWKLEGRTKRQETGGNTEGQAERDADGAKGDERRWGEGCAGWLRGESDDTVGYGEVTVECLCPTLTWFEF